jgi:hypothetical protein
MMTASFKTRSRPLGAFLLLCAAIAFSPYFPVLPEAAAQAANPLAVPQVSAVQPGPAPPLTIFYTGEVTGWTEPCG